MSETPNDDPDPARRFVFGEVERRASLTRAEYLEDFAGRRPVLIEGGARETPAFRRWTPEYVREHAGHAELELLAGLYEPEAREAGYPDVRSVTTTVRDVIESLLEDDPSRGYVFNNPSSVMRTNSAQPEFDIGWKEGANPGLAALDADFELPDFVREQDLIHAFLVLGGARHRAPLHYDLGGEAKALVGIRGRKRVLLFHPSEARRLSFPGWFDEPQPFRVPHAAEVNVHRPDFERFPLLEGARCLEAVVEEGDVLYWPSFWPHDVTNLDRLTLAVGCAFEELGASSMLIRESLGFLGQLYLAATKGEAQPSAEVGETFRRLEELVMSEELGRLRTFYGWHAKLFSS